MNKILITGGAGFIGSHLCKRLVQDKNNYVIALDNLYSGDINNIKELLNYNNFEFKNWDIINPIDIEVDQIYNTACPASPPHYQKDPIFTTKTCIIGTLNLLELAKKYNASFLQFSTSEVYGDPSIHPQIENYWGNVNPNGIRSCYDEGKRCAETLCCDFYRQYNLPIKIIRIFNTYGEFMSPYDGRVIVNFINQALKNEDLTVYGNGNQTRSFCYIDDLIDGIILAMNSNDNCGFPINLGNPSEFTILELANLVIKLTNSKSKIIFLPLPQDDPTQRRPDIALAKNILNWKPNISLEQGLTNTIRYFQGMV